MSVINNFDTLNRIQQLCRLNGWTLYKLAQQSGIPYSNLNNIINRGTQPTIPTLEKICYGFDITLAEFFSTDTPLNLASDNLSIVERKIIERYRTLNKNDKKLFQAYLDGLTKN